MRSVEQRRVQRRGRREPRQERRVLHRVPGPVAAPAQHLVGPPAAEHDRHGEEDPGHQQPGPQRAQEVVAQAAREERRARRGRRGWSCRRSPGRGTAGGSPSAGGSAAAGSARARRAAPGRPSGTAAPGPRAGRRRRRRRRARRRSPTACTRDAGRGSPRWRRRRSTPITRPQNRIDPSSDDHRLTTATQFGHRARADLGDVADGEVVGEERVDHQQVGGDHRAPRTRRRSGASRPSPPRSGAWRPAAKPTTAPTVDDQQREQDEVAADRRGHGFGLGAAIAGAARPPCARRPRGRCASAGRWPRSRSRSGRGTRCRGRPSGGGPRSGRHASCVPSTTTPIRSRNICGGTPLHLTCVSAPCAVDHVELDARGARAAADRAVGHQAAEPDGGADRLVAGGLELGRPPVVDEVLADPAEAQGEDRDGRDGERRGTSGGAACVPQSREPVGGRDCRTSGRRRGGTAPAGSAR